MLKWSATQPKMPLVVSLQRNSLKVQDGSQGQSSFGCPKTSGHNLSRIKTLLCCQTIQRWRKWHLTQQVHKSHGILLRVWDTSLIGTGLVEPLLLSTLQAKTPSTGVLQERTLCWTSQMSSKACPDSRRGFVSWKGDPQSSPEGRLFKGNGNVKTVSRRTT